LRAHSRDHLRAQQGIGVHEREAQTFAKQRFVLHVAIDELLPLAVRRCPTLALLEQLRELALFRDGHVDHRGFDGLRQQTVAREQQRSEQREVKERLRRATSQPSPERTRPHGAGAKLGRKSDGIGRFRGSGVAHGREGASPSTARAARA
jgi:hypothetical protein